MFRSWILLFIAFIVYTLLVYSYCDKNANGDIGDPRIRAGWVVWQEKNCQSCHQVYGLGGYMGPDLTNSASDTGRDEKYLRTFIKYGSGKMPNFNLNDSDVSNLIIFLKWVSKTGNSKVPREKVTWSGNYNLGN